MAKCCACTIYTLYMDIPRRHYRVYDQELSKVVLDQQAFIIPADRLSRFMV